VEAEAILLAEDEESDVLWFRRALKKAGIAQPLVSVPNGRDAMRYLLGHEPFTDRSQNPLPALIVLDLKMPIADGFDVLRWLQTRAELQHVPAVVLTSSNQSSDRARALELGACGYFIKPSNPSALLATVEEMHRRWLGQGEAPIPG
jgi:two-component system, response regulator